MAMNLKLRDRPEHVLYYCRPLAPVPAGSRGLGEYVLAVRHPVNTAEDPAAKAALEAASPGRDHPNRRGMQPRTALALPCFGDRRPDAGSSRLEGVLLAFDKAGGGGVFGRKELLVGKILARDCGLALRACAEMRASSTARAAESAERAEYEGRVRYLIKSIRKV
jgi:hypothetical protein